MREMMQRLENECVMRTAVARDNFAQFCELNGNSITDRPQFKGSVSASWREEIGEADHRLVFCTRHYDLVILGHPTGPNGLPPDLLERLLLGSGRPLLIAPPRVSEQLLGTGKMLMATARSHDANLLLMGGYGHSRAREIVFGGYPVCTRIGSDDGFSDALM